MAVKQNDIRIGSRENPFLSLDNSDIISVNGNLACDLLCEEIPIDTLEIQCRYDRMHRVFAPSDYDGLQSADGLSFRSREGAVGSVLDIPYATGLWYFNDDKYIGKFYVSDAKRTGKNVYTITAQSAMGVLDGMTYYGKLFLNQTLPEVLEDIILTDGLRQTNTPFLVALHASLSLSEGLDTVKVSGWIPSCTKREALHHVLFAQGLNIFKAENDAFLISRVSASSVGDIDPKNVYDSGSVDLTDRVKLIEVTEHAFIPNLNAEDAVLYDNTDASVDTEAVVSFDSAPIVKSTVKATGTIKIKALSENCAVISGVGTLTGKPYTHTSNVIARSNGGVLDGQTVTVSDATLVNTLNSNAVADRLFAYYAKRKQMQVPIVLSGERCGMKYGCVSPYGDAIDAYIAAMTIQASAIAKADCKLISGYVPPKGSGEFTHMVLLTGSGTFTVPQEVLEAEHPRIRFVLIGGGQGGYAGAGGEYGPESPVKTNDDLAKPGKAGENGSPGRILSVQFDGADVLASYQYSCGKGGSGGEYDDTVGQMSPSEGSHTYLKWANGSKSSYNGASSDSGYLDVMTGNVYGGKSPDYSYLESGRGGGLSMEDYFDTGSVTPIMFDALPGSYVENSETAARPEDIGTVRSAAGGTCGECVYGDGKWKPRHWYCGGGGGGGPVTPATKNPEECNGTDTIVDDDAMVVRVGCGGRGADGMDAPSPMELNRLAYGQGGIGGMGGGGGGSAGWINKDYNWSYYGYEVVDGFVGAGGKGGRGSAGAPGCILVYY